MMLKLLSLVTALMMLCRNYAEICRCASQTSLLFIQANQSDNLAEELFVGPLLPVQLCGNTLLKYTYSTIFFGIVIDGRLLRSDQVYEMCRSDCNEIIMLIIARVKFPNALEISVGTFL